MKDLLLLLALTGVICAADQSAPAVGWETVSTGPAKVAVPKGWKNVDGRQRLIPIWRYADGVGVPSVDETGTRLVIILTVATPPPSKDSAEAIARELAKREGRDPRAEMDGGKPPVQVTQSIEPVTLHDQTAGTLVTTEYIKDDESRILSTKLVAKGSDGRVWVVTGRLQGGKDSKWPTAKSSLATWLRAHVVSLTLTGKEVDPKSLEAAYRDRESQK